MKKRRFVPKRLFFLVRGVLFIWFMGFFIAAWVPIVGYIFNNCHARIEEHKDTIASEEYSSALGLCKDERYDVSDCYGTDYLGNRTISRSCLDRRASDYDYCVKNAELDYRDSMPDKCKHTRKEIGEIYLDLIITGLIPIGLFYSLVGLFLYLFPKK